VLVIVVTKSPPGDPPPGTFFQINGLEPRILGRGSSADLRIKHSSISREHVKFHPESHAWSVEDLGSRNGTLFNNAKLTGRKILQKGHQFNIGLFGFKVYSASRPTEQKGSASGIKKSNEPIAVPKIASTKSEPVKAKTPDWFTEDLLRHPDDHEPKAPEYGGGSEQDNMGTGIFPAATEDGWGVIAERHATTQAMAAPEQIEALEEWDEPFEEDRPAKKPSKPKAEKKTESPAQAKEQKETDDAGKPLRSMETPKIMRDTITDADLTSIEDFAKLNSLNLSKSQVTDVGLKYLRKLENLRSLDLEGTNVTDWGIEHLLAMKHLTFLDLTDTQLTEKGIETLLKGLPDCRLVY